MILKPDDWAREARQAQHLRRRAELAEALALTLQAQRDRAEADAAAWIAFVGEAAWQLEHGAKCEEIQSDLVEAYQCAVDGNAPGAALLTELEAARAVVEAARMTHNGASVETRQAGMRLLGARLDAYDEAVAVKARAAVEAAEK